MNALPRYTARKVYAIGSTSATLNIPATECASSEIPTSRAPSPAQNAKPPLYASESTVAESNSAVRENTSRPVPKARANHKEKGQESVVDCEKEGHADREVGRQRETNDNEGTQSAGGGASALQHTF